MISSDIPDIASIRGGQTPSGAPKNEGTPDIASIREGMETPEKYKGFPQMKATDDSIFTKASDFISDVGDQIKYNDSYSGVQNMWRGLFNSVKQAVPVQNEQGAFMGTRSETDEEQGERIRLSTEENRSKLHDSIAAEVAAKGLEIVTDPSSWLPIGQTYKAAALIGSGVAAADMAAYGLAEDGEIDPKDVGIAAAFGVILGPAIKYVGDSVVSAYKRLRSDGVSHKEAMQLALPSPEQLKALPAPQKRLPAPTKVVDKADEVEKAWQEKSLNEWIKKDDQISKAWSAHQGVNAKSIREAVDSGRAAAKTEADILSESTQPDSIMAHAFDNMSEKQADGIKRLNNHLNQGGSLSESLMHHMAASSLGAAVGGVIDGEEGAIIGGMLGMGMPLAFRHTRKSIGKIKDWSKDDAASVLANGHIWSSPTAVLKGFGEAGRSLAEKINLMTENIDLQVADKLWTFEKKVGHLSSDELTEMRKLMNHTLKPSQASPHALQAAKQMRREFNQVLDDAVRAGVMSGKKASKLKAKASKDGYFPRIYDKDLLSSNAGKEAWVKAWSNEKLPEKDLHSALKSILGDKDAVADFVKNINKSRDGSMQLSQSQALDLLRVMMNKGHHARSSHLENPRIFGEIFEKKLEPFLIQDPSAVIARYFQDSYRRIESSKIFDGIDSKFNFVQDYHADNIFKRISAERSVQDADFARQTYYTAIGDSNSEIIRSSMKLGDQQRKFLQGVASFETATKLSTAQMLNMMQATVNGITRLNNLTANPFKSLSIYARGLSKSMSKEGGEFAQRTGAALETTMMEIAGEGSQIGKHGERVLKYTGFIAAEKIQRRLGANIGRVYAEDLVEKLAKIKAGKIVGKRANKIKRQAKEMGIPFNRAVTDTDMYRAGLRFSNDINFRNTPDKVPLAWQTPYGRLLTKFKSFAFHQSRFIKDNVIKPLLRGNPAPLIWYAGAGAGIGMSIDELRRVVKGDDREFTETERYLRGLTSIGGIGLLQDLITTGATKEGGLAAAIAGPGISDAGRLLIGAKKLVVDQNPKKALDDIQRMFVFPGKGYIVDELSSEGSSRGKARASSNRGGGR